MLLSHLDNGSLIAAKSVQYRDIYGTVNEQKSIVKIMIKLLKIRTDLLDKQVTPASGVVLDVVPQLGNKEDQSN